MTLVNHCCCFCLQPREVEINFRIWSCPNSCLNIHTTPENTQHSSNKINLSSDSSKKAVMKTFLVIFTLMAAMITIGATVDTNKGLHPYNTTLTADAIDLLAANGIWAPNLTAFAVGDFNMDGVNSTAEEEKFNQSGLDINDLVQVRIDSSALMAHAVGDAGGGGGGIISSEKGQCDQCSLCTKTCAAWTFLWIV